LYWWQWSHLPSILLFFSFTLVNYGHEGRRGEYPLIMVFIQQKVPGFHLHERPIDLKFFNQKLPSVGQTSWANSASEPINFSLPGS